MRKIKKNPTNLIPLKGPILFASIKSLLIPSATIRKRRRDNGNPYLNSLIGLKKQEAMSVNGSENDTNEKRLITQLIKGIQNPK
jgi:hypothetical protein